MEHTEHLSRAHRITGQDTTPPLDLASRNLAKVMSFPQTTRMVLMSFVALSSLSAGMSPQLTRNRAILAADFAMILSTSSPSWIWSLEHSLACSLELSGGAATTVASDDDIPR